jgi:UDP-sugar diphosphatase
MVTDGKTGTSDDGLEYFKGIGRISGKGVIELDNGLKVGLLGLMGEDADEKAPIAPPVTFNHDFDFIQSKVDELKNNDGAQLIVALSHSGVSSSGEGDDANLANGVDGIDLIASGHEHTATHEAFNESGTLIFSPGAYGRYVSRMDVAYSISQGRIVDSKFALIEIDDKIEGDPYIQGMIGLYNDGINAALAPLGVALDSPISQTDFSLTLRSLQESTLGNLIADANRTIATQAAAYSADPTPFAFSVVPSGVIRHNIDPGKTGVITFADIYNTLPLGISPDQSQPLPGYPLMSVYLTAAEIRNVLEAGLTLAPQLGSDYYLNFSGVRVTYNITMAPYLQGVSSVKLCGNALPAPYGDQDFFCTSCDTELDLAGTDLYRCVVDLYAMQMMHVITYASYGMLPIVPKHADGSPINMGNPADYLLCRIDADPATSGVQELKEWMPLWKYLGNVFGAGIPDTIYGSQGIAMGRITVPTP